jgi:CBS domain-containing protein
MKIRVSDVMTRSIILVHAHATAKEMATLIRDNNISSLIVLQDNRMLGIVTEHDLAGKVMAAGLDPAQTNATGIMSAPVVTIDSEAEIEEAARLMRDHRIKKLVAVKNGKAEGIITSFDMIVAEPVIELFAEKSL